MAYRSGNTEGRNAFARARGFKSYYEYRQAAAAHPIDQRITPRRSLGAGGQESTYTRSEGQLRAAINRAAAKDLTIYARVTMLIRGQTRDVEIWSKGGWNAQDAADAMDDAGGAFALIGDQLAAIDKYPGSILNVQLRAVAA